MAEGEVEEAEQDLLVELLANGRTHAEAGIAIGKSSKSVQRRLADPDLVARIAARRADRLGQAAGRLGEAVLDAVDTMTAELQADRSADRLRAAALILSSLVKVREQIELDQALASLREEIAALREEVASQ